MANIWLAMLLGYYWTGTRMLLCHSTLPAFQRPSYTNGGFAMKTVAVLFWPYVCARNRELGWFVASLIGSVVAIAVILGALTHWMSYFWAICILGTLQVIRVPFLSSLYAWAVTIPASLVLWLSSKLFGVQVPTSMERFAR